MGKQTLITIVLGVFCGVVFAAPAQAAKFTAGAYPAQVSGEQAAEVKETTINGGTVFGFEKKLMTECETVTFVGTLSEASTSLTVTPTILGCRSFETNTGSVALNGCQYRFQIGSGSGDLFSGTMDIVCSAGKKIVVTGNNCEVEIGPQTGIEAIAYKNETETLPPSVTIAFTESANGFDYTTTKDGLFCPLNGTGSHTDGVVVGGATMTALNGGKATALTIK